MVPEGNLSWRIDTGPPESVQLRLLVVDDDEADLRAVRRSLYQAGVSATMDAAMSAAGVLERLAAARYDCLFLDYYLPDANELSLIRAIQEVAPDLPIVVFTGRGDEEIAVELMKAGVADYIPKTALRPERLAASLRYALALARAAAAQRRAEAELRAQEALFHGLADAIPQLAWMADAKGERTWFNWRWFDYTGTTLDEVRGSGWQKVLDPEHLPSVIETFQHSLASGEPWEETFPLRRRDGTYRWFLSRAVPRRGADGGITGWIGTNTDITEQREAERALRGSEERFRRALAIETVGVLFFNTEGAITEANDAFLRMAGFTRADVAAGLVRWDELTPPEWMPRSLQAVEEFKTTGRTTPYEKEYFRKDGGRWWALFAATRLNEHEGVEFVIGITARKQAEEELRRAAARAEAAAAAKSRFLTATSHDLRQPLQAIMLAHDLLQEILAEEKGRTALLQAQRASERLARAFDKLVEIARLESDVFVPKRQIFPIQPLLDDIVETCGPAAREKGLALSVARCGERVDSDPAMLSSILQNLIGNALKYTERGSVAVAYRRRGALLQVEVRDSGIGIPADKLDDIFREYERLDTGTPEGLGLGLAIVARCAELLGHRISVESEVGVGSCFRVELPAVAPEPILQTQ